MSAPDQYSDELALDLAAVLNRHSVENLSNTPDHVLAAYLVSCLITWQISTELRDAWWGVNHQIGGGS